MRAPRFAGILALALSCAGAATAVHAQATRPAPAAAFVDPYQETPLPARRNAPATQSTGVAGATGPADPFDSKRLGIALLIVLGAIVVAHQVYKRIGMPGANGRASGTLQVVSRLNLAPKQQILLIRVGRRLVLVGNSGSQMSSLCEITDPEEAAGLIGQVAVERDESPSSFSAVLGDEEKQFDQQTNIDVVAGDDRELANTREEISGLMDKVRNLSNQFKRA
jgi:flagellar biogenesis protein FliO